MPEVRLQACVTSAPETRAPSNRRAAYALSSRSSGVRKRGVTRFAPSHASSRAAWPETAAAPSAPMSSSSRQDDLPGRALRPAAHHAALPPDGRADVAGPVEQRRPVLAEEPVPRLPPHRRRVERGQQRRDGGRPRPGNSRSSASATPGCPSSSTSAVGSAASAALVCPPVQPPHHCRSDTGAGPNERSHRRASSTRAAPPSSPPSPGRRPRRSQAEAAKPLELPRRPAAAPVPAHQVPLGAEQREHPRGDVGGAAVALVERVGELRPQPRLALGQLRPGRAAAAARAEPAARPAPTSRSHPPGSPSPTPPVARSFSSCRRSRLATSSVHAACTTGTSPAGTTNIVRRIPSIRTSERSA